MFQQDGGSQFHSILENVNKRLKFGDGRGAAPFQSAVVYLGEDLDRFNDVFGKYGKLYVPHRNLSHNMQTNLSKLL